jgi:hypothetical protein
MQFDQLKRREFITLLGGAAAALPLNAHAQQPTNIPRLCFLTFDPAASRSTRFGAFFQGLRDLGYVDGQTIIIDYLSADGRGERLLAPTSRARFRERDLWVAIISDYAALMFSSLISRSYFA